MKRKSSKEIEIRRVEAKGRYDEREEESNNGRRERERKIEELSKSALKTDLRSILDRLNEKARNEREKWSLFVTHVLIAIPYKPY